MVYLVTFHAGWLLGSLLIGLATGWIAVVYRGPSVSGSLMLALSALAAALVAIALTCVVPGLAGYWLELGLLLFLPYLAGCAVGSWLRAFVLSRSMSAKPVG
jgi:hypothetical protein